jgi:hypothetical protein
MGLGIAADDDLDEGDDFPPPNAPTPSLLR